MPAADLERPVNPVIFQTETPPIDVHRCFNTSDDHEAGIQLATRCRFNVETNVSALDEVGSNPLDFSAWVKRSRLSSTEFPTRTVGNRRNPVRWPFFWRGCGKTHISAAGLGHSSEYAGLVFANRGRHHRHRRRHGHRQRHRRRTWRSSLHVRHPLFRVQQALAPSAGSSEASRWPRKRERRPGGRLCRL
jgi:hypothetical protein